MHRGRASPGWDANSPQHPKVLLFQQKVVVKQPTCEPPAAHCSPEAGIRISPSTSPGSAGPHPARCCRRRCQRGECQPGGFLQTPASSGRLIINCVSSSNCCSRQRSWTRHQKQLASPPRRYAAACSAPCSRPPRAAKGGRRSPASSTGCPLLRPQHQSWAGSAPGPGLIAHGSSTPELLHEQSHHGAQSRLQSRCSTKLIFIITKVTGQWSPTRLFLVIETVS